MSRAERRSRTPIDDALVRRARNQSAATLHEAAGGIGALPSAIKPIHPPFRVCGPALTVATAAGDNLAIHRGLARAAPGFVLVVTTQGAYEAGYWGEILSCAALARGVGGVVLDACVRDGDRLGEIGVSVFARGLCIRGTTKNIDLSSEIGEAISIDDTTIETDDLVVGDADGVVVVPNSEVATVIRRAEEREQHEAQIMDQLTAGATTIDLLGLTP